MGSKVKTRMAPSPTGEYHIGHIRTVLYNVAFAKKNKGTFLVRIEDTDRERYVEGAVDRILNVIEDYGFKWDEGPRSGGNLGPYMQSERLDLYREYAQKLVEAGKAYYCFCSRERLEEIRESQRKKGMSLTKYDRHCLGLSNEEVKSRLEKKEPNVIRLKVPDNREISFKDEVYGRITVNSNDLDDQILLKSDGYPSYHLGVVVDDHLMEVTHVMRGNDWLPSTPKHILLYEAFGWTPPVYIHLPNLKEEGDTKKLSKRYGSIDAADFLKEGYLPEAVINFLMFLGWNPGTEREVYSLDEFVDDFSVDRIHKTDLVAFDRKKLLWLNGCYIRSLSHQKLWEMLTAWSEKFGVKLSTTEKSEAYNIAVLSLVQERLKKFDEFNDLTHYFYFEPEVKEKLLIKYAGDKAKDILESFKKLYFGLNESNWIGRELEEVSRSLPSEKNCTSKEVFMTLRVAVSGEEATPPIFEILEVIGKEKVLLRIDKAAEMIGS